MLGALEGRSHVIPRDFVRLLVSYLAASVVASTLCNSPPPDAADKYFRALYVEHRCRVRGHRLTPKRASICRILTDFGAVHQL